MSPKTKIDPGIRKMLIATNEGRTCSIENALEMFEVTIPALIPEDELTYEFVQHYADSLNRIRWLARRVSPVKPKLYKYKKSSILDYYNCGTCGKTITGGVGDNYCSGCGRRILWDSIRCLTDR